MATGAEVLAMLIPTGGWVITGNNYEGIQFLECAPITKGQFEAGFAQCDLMQKSQNTKIANDKAALLERLGITADEAALLLS